jgi:hypothetical protein
MSVECDHLDAYLGGDLSPDDVVHYESHLVACETCREAVNQQRWIDALLSSPERLDLERVSPALSRSARNSVASRRRHARFVACGIAAAAALVLALGWTAVLMQDRNATRPAVNQVAETATRNYEPSPSPSLKGSGNIDAPRAVFVAGPDVLVIPVVSRHPNVTVVRVYPTYQPSLAAQAASDDSDAGIFNGG